MSPKKSKPAESSNKTSAKGLTAAKQFVEISLKIMPTIIEIIIPKMETFAETIDTEGALDPFDIADKTMDVITEVYDELKWRFEELGTDPHEFETWAKNHNEELNEYLAKQPEIQKKFEAYQNELNKILSPDSLKEHKARKKNNPTPVEGFSIEKAVDVQVKFFTKIYELIKQKLDSMSDKMDTKEKEHFIRNLFDEFLSSGSPEIDAEMQALGTSRNEFISWTDVHGKEMEAYIYANPELEQNWLDLQKKMQNLNEEMGQEISDAEKAALDQIEATVKAAQQELEASERERGPLKFEVKDGHVIMLNLSNLHLKSVPAEVGSLKYLEWIQLYNNALDSLPDEIANLTKLKRLALGNNKFTHIRFDFGKLEALETLDLTMNHHLSSMPEGITKLKSLNRLELSGDFILPKNMAKLTSLRSLALRGEPAYDDEQPFTYRLKIASLESLASIETLTSLEELTITFSDIESIPPYILNMTSLTNLGISFSKLTSIPDSIGKLKSLDTFSLAGNKLVSIDPIGKLPSLFSLFLNDNQLTTLPESIVNIKNLDFLDYTNNPITVLPDSVKKWIKSIEERGGMVSGSK